MGSPLDAGLFQHLPMPGVATAGHLQRAQREQAGPSDRSMEVIALGETGLQIFISLQLEAGVASHDHGPRVHGEFELQTQQAVHVGDLFS